MHRTKLCLCLTRCSMASAGFLPAGAQLAVLEGRPDSVFENFTVKLRCQAATSSPRGTGRENATVISGNFKVGSGDAFDESKMTTFGRQLRIPGPEHAPLCNGKWEVVVQVHGMSPLPSTTSTPTTTQVIIRKSTSSGKLRR
jgi:hypothetical protein